jgi:nitrate/nitrite transporter NarK
VSTSNAVTPGAIACLAGAWLLSVVTQGFVVLPASVLPQMAAGVSVPESAAVWVISAAPGAWAASNLAAGSLIDRRGDTAATVGATALFVVGCLWCWRAALDGSFVSLVAARLLAGVGLGVVWTASANLVGRTFPRRVGGTALGVFTTSAPAGFALAQVLGPELAAWAGWPALFAATAALAVPALATFLLGVRTAALAPRTGTAGLDSVRAVLGHRGVVLGGCAAFAAYSLYLFLNSWLPTYLTGQVGMARSTASVLAAVFPAMGVVSRAGGGVVSDRVFGGFRTPVLRLSFLTATPAVVGIWLLPQPLALVALLVVAGFVVQLTFGVVYSYVRECVDEDISGTALSFLGTTGIAGAFSAPLVAGGLIDQTGTFAAAFAYAALLGALGLVAASLAPEP